MQAAEAFAAAVRHHQAGQFAEADRLYARVLDAEPRHLQALHLRGALAHMAGRNDEAVALIGRALALDDRVPDLHYNIGLALWALGRQPEATDHWSRAVALKPDFAQARLNLGNALREQGRFDEAIAQHRTLAQQFPQAPPAHNSLGLSCAKAGRHDEAMAHYERAVALQPDFRDAWLNLAVSRAACGQTAEALAAAMRAIDIADTPEGRALFVRLVAGLAAVGDDPALRRLLARALSEGWAAPGILAPAAIALIRNGPAAALIGRAARAWPERLGVDLPGALDDPLLLALLDATVICDAELEKFLAACRFALLEAALSGAQDARALPLACALAQQCDINEYVYGFADGEEARAQSLRARLDAALASGAAVPPLWVAAVAAYAPLSTLAAADALLARTWPAPVMALLVRQISEPRQQAADRAAIPQLTPIEDAVSRAVQAQYEENPYPRWIRTAAPRRYVGIAEFLRETFPSIALPAFPAGGRPDILIAGCGTGQHAILTAQQFEGARVLAVDLSRASLGYALAKTRAMGLATIEYAQADIMRLDALDRAFDLIESTGVLHHLADPYAGWRVLSRRLRPGGFMRIGLYSEIARWSVVAARGLIAQQGYGATAADIRRFRRDLMRRDDDLARNIMRFNDFYSMSECRDLLFHAQEHRMTLPAIKAFLTGERLRFLGFEIDADTVRRYAARFPADTAMTDLDAWHAFEQDNRETFSNMYRFWVWKEPQ